MRIIKKEPQQKKEKKRKKINAHKIDAIFIKTNRDNDIALLCLFVCVYTSNEFIDMIAPRAELSMCAVCFIFFFFFDGTTSKNRFISHDDKE